MIEHNISRRKRLYSAMCAGMAFLYLFTGFQTVKAMAPGIDTPTESKPSIEITVTKPIVKPTVGTTEATETTKPTEIPTVTEPIVVPETEQTIIETTTPTKPEEPTVHYFDVPLSKDLQTYIFEFCEYYNIDPAIIIAMINKESTFNPEAIGDKGNSFGLMQLQPRWFQQKMMEFGITNCGEGCTHDTCLLDPYQNVTLGIDYVAELISTGKSIEWVLMAYNGGPVYADGKAAEGIVTDYAKTVLEYAWALGG